jgi:hypothetical protein
VFIDDIAQHHDSAFQITPQIGRLHLCGEPEMAPISPAPFRQATPMPASTIGRALCPG